MSQLMKDLQLRHPLEASFSVQTETCAAGLVRQETVRGCLQEPRVTSDIRAQGGQVAQDESCCSAHLGARHACPLHNHHLCNDPVYE